MSGSTSATMSWGKRGWFGIVCWLALGSIFLARAQDAPPQRTESIHVSVELVNVGVIVTDANGHFVENLQRDDFHVFDNGIEQTLNNFTPVEEPAQLVLLIEAGPAVYLLEAGHLRAANSLLKGLSAGDRVAVAKYDEAAQGVLDFTSDKQTVGAAFEQLRFNLGFGSLNLSSSLSTVLDWLTKVPGKKTVVLLSSGFDTSSESAWNTLIQRLKTSEVRVLAVSLTGGLRPAPPAQQTSKKKSAAPAQPSFNAQQFDRADQVLKQIAEASGGRAYYPKTTQDFGVIYAQIAQLVRHEYSLAYAPPARDAAVHSIDVRISNASATPPAYRIDHRQAYVAPASAAP